MYLIAGILGCLYLCLFLLSRGESSPETMEKVLQPFYRMAMLIYKKACIMGIPIFNGGQVQQDLERLYPGRRREGLRTEYYVKKLGMVLLMVLLGTFLGTILKWKTDSAHILGSDNSIKRGSYGEEEQEIEVSAVLEDKLQDSFRVRVRTKKLERAEAERLCDDFLEKLPELILGENPSLDQISENLILEEYYEGYPFHLTWTSENPLVITDTGLVCWEDIIESKTVMLQAVLQYYDWQWHKELTVRVMPPRLTREQQFRKELGEMLAASEEESRGEDVWTLPESWQNQKIIWKQYIADYSLLTWAGVVATAVLVYVMSDKDLHDKLLKRQREMKRDYPDIVHKLVLYLGAGMTIRGAMQKLGADYEQSLAAGAGTKVAYEEILYTIRELQAGVSEGAAYEHLGKRTGVQEYIRMSTLLMQNLKKGNSTLLQRLREEAERASVERLQHSRRLGEEAVTKLLIPMIMMLAIVMILIMIPAFSTMGF